MFDKDTLDTYFQNDRPYIQPSQVLQFVLKIFDDGSYSNYCGFYDGIGDLFAKCIGRYS
jgi:hypothetical protein